jgi:hypothetical protein
MQETFLRIFERWERVSVVDDPDGAIGEDFNRRSASGQEKVTRRTRLPVSCDSPGGRAPRLQGSFIDEDHDLEPHLTGFLPRCKGQVVRKE